MHISFSKLKYKFYCKILAALFYKFWFSFSSRNCPRFSIWHDGITRCLNGPCQKLLLWCRFRPQLNVGPYSRRNVDTIISLIYLEEMVLILWPTNINVADHDKIHWLWGWWCGMPSLFLLQEPQVLLLKSQLLFFVSLPSFQFFYVVIKKLNGFRWD